MLNITYWPAGFWCWRSKGQGLRSEMNHALRGRCLWCGWHNDWRLRISQCYLSEKLRVKSCDEIWGHPIGNNFNSSMKGHVSNQRTLSLPPAHVHMTLLKYRVKMLKIFTPHNNNAKVSIPPCNCSYLLSSYGDQSFSLGILSCTGSTFLVC